MPHCDEPRVHNQETLNAFCRGDYPFEQRYVGGVHPSYDNPPLHEKLRRMGMEHPEPAPSLAEEVAKLRETVEELVYWMRPQMGQIITGKAAVEEFERITGRKP